MDINIHRRADGIIEISSYGKTMKIKIPKKEFYSEDIHIKVSSKEPVIENNQTQYKDIELGRLDIDIKNKIDIKEQQKQQKRQYRLNELKKEAFTNLKTYISNHNLILYKIFYKNINKSIYADRYNCLRAKHNVQKILKDNLYQYITNEKSENSINLNPSRKKDIFYIDIDVLSQQMTKINEELTKDNDDFVVHNTSNQDVINKLKKQNIVMVIKNNLKEFGY